jgi:hypothetical protein
MNQELQKYYDSLFDLFGTEGWKTLTQQLEQNKEAVSSIRDIPDAKLLHFRQGQLDVIEILLNMPSITEQSYKAAQESPE